MQDIFARCLRSVFLQSILAISSIYSLSYTLYMNYFYIPYGSISVAISDAGSSNNKKNFDGTFFCIDENILTKKGQKILSSIVRIENDGKTFIRKEDFDVEMPLSLVLSSGRFIDFYPQKSMPDKIIECIYLSKSHKKIGITPLLFQPGDFIEFKAFIICDENEFPEIKPSGRIAGVRIDKPSDDSLIATLFKWGAIVCLGILTLILSLITFSLIGLAKAKRTLIATAKKYESSEYKFIQTIMKEYLRQIPRGYHYIKGVLRALYAMREQLSSGQAGTNFSHEYISHYHLNFDDAEITLDNINQWIILLQDFRSKISQFHARLGTD